MSLEPLQSISVVLVCLSQHTAQWLCRALGQRTDGTTTCEWRTTGVGHRGANKSDVSGTPDSQQAMSSRPQSMWSPVRGVSPPPKSNDFQLLHLVPSYTEFILEDTTHCTTCHLYYTYLHCDVIGSAHVCLLLSNYYYYNIQVAMWHRPFWECQCVAGRQQDDIPPYKHSTSSHTTH